MRALRFAAVLGLIGLTLTACSRERPLEGERVDLRAPWGGGEPTVNRVQPINLPAQASNAAWTQRQGGSGERPRHPALAANPQLAWSESIGAGDSRRARLTTDPVVAGGRIFTLDARTRVQATSPAGAVLWSSDVLPARGARGSASGGALAVAGNRLFVASAFAFVAALDVETGRELWRTDFDSPLTGSPAVGGDVVYVSAIDSTLWGLDAATGRIRWTLPGTPSLTSVARGSAPAIAGDLAIFPTQSGELTAVRRSNGAQTWTSVAAGRRTGAALATIDAITGDPVVDGNRVYVANQSGRLLALDTRSGATIWSIAEGTTGPVWPVGGSVFFVSDQNRLMRVDARDGATIWAQELPLYRNDRPRRRLGIFAQYGPVLAGGRLWVASGDGPLRGFDPATGAPVIELSIPGGAASAPIVAGGALYVLGRNGTLNAIR